MKIFRRLLTDHLHTFGGGPALVIQAADKKFVLVWVEGDSDRYQDVEPAKAKSVKC